MAEQEVAASGEPPAPGTQVSASPPQELGSSTILFLVNRMDAQHKEALDRIDRVVERMDAQHKEVLDRIDRVAERMDAKIDRKVDGLRNYVILPVLLVMLAGVLAHFVPV